MSSTFSAASAATTTAAERRVPPFGGFSLALLTIELRRSLRNRRTMIFTIVLPMVFFLAFGTNESYRSISAGHGNVTSSVMIHMALYGAMLATISGGASVSFERAQGWSRQLRLTPLHPLAYIGVKAIAAMTLGLVSSVAVFIVGHLLGADLSLGRTIACIVIIVFSSFMLAAFGLFMGYVLPGQNVMQILGPVIALLSFLGGLFIPLSQMPGFWQTAAQFTPLYGISTLANIPLATDGFPVAGLINLVVWAAIFMSGAAWTFSRDTDRV